MGEVMEMTVTAMDTPPVFTHFQLALLVSKGLLLGTGSLALQLLLLLTAVVPTLTRRLPPLMLVVVARSATLAPLQQPP